MVRITILAILGIIGIFTIPFVLGTFFGMSLQEPKVEVRYVNTTEIKYVDSQPCLVGNLSKIDEVSSTSALIITNTNITPSKYSNVHDYPYGGIPTSINYPPNSAVISKELTEKNNNHTIAVDEYGNVWYFVGSWGWFNQTEYDTLPKDNKLYDVSPYATHY